MDRVLSNTITNVIMVGETSKTQQEGSRKSIVILGSTSRIPKNYQGAEETEIAAQISLPDEGRWGWVIVTTSFFCLFIVDGIFFTFGAILFDMALDLGVQESLIALINSITAALYYLAGPVTSALINRFGFRACTMTGSIICSSSCLATYFSTSYAAILTFYGFFCGFGSCLIGMTSGIVVGFYFERLRSLAMSISGVGSSAGVMIFFSLNAYIVNIAGWRITTLFHSGLLGLIYFLGMTFRPIISLTVTRTVDDPTRTVTYLPNLSATTLIDSSSSIKKVNPNTAERLFGAVSNVYFPTAAEMLDEGVLTTASQAGPSNATESKLVLKTNNPTGGISQRQLKQVQSFVSKAIVHEETNKKYIELILDAPVETKVKKPGFWARLFRWEKHAPASRPMYRDDAFYNGKLSKLPEYQKSVLATPEDEKTGLEYQLAVTRAVTTDDLNERRGIFTTAARRILVTMLDPELLKRKSFMCLCLNGFCVFLGFLVPYVYLTNRNKEAGIHEAHCSMFVSVIGLANAMGKLAIGAIATVYSPLKLYILSSIMIGASTVAFNFSFAVYYQYAMCISFGLASASYYGLRGLVIVELYGLHSLTNAMGMLVMFQGMGTLISTPMSSVLKGHFGYSVSFYVAGVVMIIGGVVIIPVKTFLNNENKDKGLKTDVSLKKNKT